MDTGTLLIVAVLIVGVGLAFLLFVAPAFYKSSDQ